MKMTLKDLAAEVSMDLQLSNAKAEIQLKAIFNCIGENVAAGHEINIPGFGKFKTNQTKERQARNPKTGEMITVPAKNNPKFLAAKALKDAANSN